MATRPARAAGKTRPQAKGEGAPSIACVWAVTLTMVTLLSLAAFGLIAYAEKNLAQIPAGGLPSVQWLNVSTLLFVLSALAGVASLKLRVLQQPTWYLILAATGIAGGVTCAIPWEMTHILSAPHIGLSNLYQVSVFTLVVTGALALGFDRTHAPGKLLPFAAPILAVAALFAAWLASNGHAMPVELAPALQNSILPLHVAANFVGYGCFALAAAAGAAILVRARADARGKPSVLPSLPVLEKLAYATIAVGFPVFTLAILLGCVWAYQAWGGYWSWDPKETWALIVWLIYAAYLHARGTQRKRPVVLAWWLIVGFAATLFCYIGVNMFLSGLHSYGSLAS